jgi:hypothetical protein
MVSKDTKRFLGKPVNPQEMFHSLKDGYSQAHFLIFHLWKLFLFNIAFNTGFEPVEAVSTAHGKSAPGLGYFTQARDISP